MNWYWNTCRGNRETLCLLASGALPKEQRTEIESHLASCAQCQKYFSEIKRVTVPLANLAESLPLLEPSQAAQLRWAKAIRTAKNSTQHAAPGWWEELFWSARYAWTSIAALWLIMWLVNWQSSPTSTTSHGSTSGPSMIEAMHEEQRMLAELIPPTEMQPAEPPRRNPPPRSEWKTPWSAC